MRFDGRPLAWSWLVLAACSAGRATGAPGDETDTDTDADTDTDTDTGTETGTGPSLPDADGDGSPDAEDCDDADPTVFPGAPDVCGDDRVTDCDRQSDDLLVTVDGGDTWSGPGALVAALAKAPSGSEVLVCPGTYVGEHVAHVPVTLRSLGGATVTTLDGDGARTLAVQGGSVVEGFVIRGGRAAGSGGGLLIPSGGAVTLSDLSIRDNHAGDSGGGLAVTRGASITFERVRIEDNDAQVGGGLWAEDADLDLGDTVITGNRAQTGGGVAMDTCSVVAGVVTDNTATSPGYAFGGGLSLSGDNTLTGTQVVGNHSTQGGGVIFWSGVHTLTDVAVEDNDARYSGGGLTLGSSGARGAEVHLEGTSEVGGNESDTGAGVDMWGYTSLYGGTVHDNVAHDQAGGITSLGGEVHDVHVLHNVAQAMQGGGLWVSGDAVLDGLEVRDNQAVTGGGVHIGSGGTVQVLGCVVADNHASGDGGGFSTNHGARFVLRDTEVSGNGAAGTGGGAVIDGTVTVIGGSIRDNTAGVGGGGLSLTDSGAAQVSGADLGTGAQDNSPDDIVLPGGDAFDAYGAAATFDCDPSTCDPPTG